MNFRRSVIIAELSWPELSRKTLKNYSNLLRFLKNDQLRENFQNSVRKGFIATSIDMLCSNFVKFSRWTICKIVGCLPDKNRLTLLLSLLLGSRPKSARANPRQCAQSARDFIQIGCFGGVIPERVNTIKTGRKVFSVFGRTLASSRINIFISDNKAHVRN